MGGRAPCSAPGPLYEALECNSITILIQPMPLQTLPLPPSELGESPFWHPTEKSLYWCDIQGQAVQRMGILHSGHHRHWNMPSEPGCCAPAAGGRLVIGLRNGFYLLDTAKRSADPNALTCVALLPPDQHDTAVLRLNDGRCDTAGRFWAGSVITPRTAPDAALWCLQADPASATGYSVRHMAGRQLHRQRPGLQPRQPHAVLVQHARTPHRPV